MTKRSLLILMPGGLVVLAVWWLLSCKHRGHPLTDRNDFGHVILRCPDCHRVLSDLTALLGC